MQARFTEEEGTAERRYRPETVQKAAALAAKLQQEQRETLSEAEVEQLAVEIGIEPQLMRQALDVVARSEAAVPPASQVAYPPPAYVSAQGQAAVQGRRRIGAGAFVGLSLPIFFAFMTVTFYFLRSTVAAAPLAPPQQVEATVLAPPVEATPPALAQSSGPIQNGGFEQVGRIGERTFHAGSTGVAGWTVAGGEVRQVAGGAEGRYALQLGKDSCVTQLIPTQPGRRYVLSVALSGVPGATRMMHRVTLSTQGFSRNVAAFTEAAGGQPSGWTRETLEFEASEPGTQIEISVDRSRADVGSPLIDDVTITPMP